MEESIYRKRVFNTLNHKESDICPYYIWIEPEVVTLLNAYFGTKDLKEEIVQDHTVIEAIRDLKTPVGNNINCDEFGTLFQEGNIPHVIKPALGSATLQGYKFPSLRGDGHFKHIPSFLENNQDKFRIVQIVDMFSERFWTLRGFEESLMDYYTNRKFTEAVFDHLMQIIIEVIDELSERFGNAIDAIGMSDDAGTENAMLIDPAMWRLINKPRLKVIFEHIRSKGYKVYLHSCGQITPIIPDLIEIGVDMLQPIQPESMDIYHLKKEFGKSITLVGGIGTQKILPFGTPEEVKNEISTALERMSKDGGYVMAPAKPIMPGVPLENAVTLINSFGRQKNENTK